MTLFNTLFIGIFDLVIALSFFFIRVNRNFIFGFICMYGIMRLQVFSYIFLIGGCRQIHAE